MLDRSGQNVCDGFNPPMRMPRKSCAIVLRILIPKVIEQQKWIKHPGIIEAKGTLQTHSGALNRRRRTPQGHGCVYRHLFLALVRVPCTTSRTSPKSTPGSRTSLQITNQRFLRVFRLFFHLFFVLPFPPLGLRCILLNPVAVLVADTETVLRTRMTLLCRFSVPPHGRQVVLLDAICAFVAETEIELGTRVTLLRRFSVPPHAFRFVLLDARAVLVAETEIALGVCITLLRRFSVPLNGLLGSPGALAVRDTETVLRTRMALFCRLSVPPRRFCQIDLDPR